MIKNQINSVLRLLNLRLIKANHIKNISSDLRYISAKETVKSADDNSIDLVHSHGVFVYLPFFDSLRYFKEIDRVSSKNVVIVFDCITEDCLDKKSLNNWLKSEYSFPRILPEKYIFDFFPNNQYKLIGNFFTPYGQGKSKYFVFKRTNLE